MADAAEKIATKSTARSGTHRIDRRARARVPLVLPAVIEHKADLHEAVTVDLGIGGALVETDVELSYGARVRLIVKLPFAPGVLRLTGVVRWLSSRGVGVHFTELGAPETHAIARLIGAEG